MPYVDLREWLAAVENRGELLRISGVSHELKMSGIAEILGRESKQPPIILFDDIPGYTKGYRTLFCMLSSPGAFAIGIGLPENELDRVSLARNWRNKRHALELIPPKMVGSGPVQENIISGDDIDLLKFPTPYFHELDGGRFFGTGHTVIIGDLDTGWVNLGTYRNMLIDRNRLALHILETQQGSIIFNEYMARNQAMPVAIATGLDPAMLFSSITTIAWGVSEYDFAGGIKGEPIPVIKGPFTGLPVPANAEIVIEGECLPGDVIEEGPFGEWHGYYANQGLEKVLEPVIQVKTVMHRNDPIMTCACGGKPPHDYTLARCIAQSGRVWDALENCSVPGVTGVWCHEAGAGSLITNISLRQSYAGHARQAAIIASQIPVSVGRYTIVVDEDVDPSDLNDVMWAVSTRADPERSIEILRYCRSCSADTVISMEEKRRTRSVYNSRAIIDACRPFDWKHEYYPVAQVPAELRASLLKEWDEIFRKYI